jgi:hypothetical protein
VIVTRATTTSTTTPTAAPTTTTRAVASYPPYPQLLAAAQSAQTRELVPAARWHGKTIVWVRRSSAGVALMEFDQSHVRLDLHSGTVDAGPSGWRFGPMIERSETRHVIAAFNGGFKFVTNAGGFFSYGRSAVPLRNGLGSVVTYSSGYTDIGAWNTEVPARRQHVVSVRQNLPLLVDHGAAAADVGCVTCWGATLGGVIDPARSGLGVTARGRLVWVGGLNLTVAELADALIAAGAVRAVQLDINPAWVVGYLYGHRGGHGPLAPVPVINLQHGVTGEYLAPWSRDFFAVVAR